MKHYWHIDEFAHTFYAAEMQKEYNDDFTRDLFIRYLSHISNVYAYSHGAAHEYYDIMAHCKDENTGETYNIACELKYRETYTDKKANGEHIIDRVKFDSFQRDLSKQIIKRGIIFSVYCDDVVYISDAFRDFHMEYGVLGNKTTRTGSIYDGVKVPKNLVYYKYLFKYYIYIFSKDGRKTWDIILSERKLDLDQMNKDYDKLSYELF